MSWSLNKMGKSDAVARAVAAEMEKCCGEHGYLAEPERGIARIAMNIMELALTSTQPPIAVQVTAQGSMSKSTNPASEMHYLEIKITPFYGYVE